MATSAQNHINMPRLTPVLPATAAGGDYERGAVGKKCHCQILSRGSLTGVSFRVVALSPGCIR